MWVKGTEATSFSNWNSSPPIPGKDESSRDFVIMLSKANSDKGKWKTKPCNSMIGLICERPGPSARQ